jgi:splicing factor 3B subunit 2
VQAQTDSVQSEDKPAKSALDSSDSEGEDDKKGGEDEEGKISKKKLRRLKRLGVGDLKQKVKKPEVVEVLNY